MTSNPTGTHLMPFTVEENSQFSLDDEEYSRNVDSQQRQVLLGNNSGFRNGTTTTINHYSSRFSSESTTQRFPTNLREKILTTTTNRESSRLTDEIELDDADSGSDDLDLLPPFTNSNTNTTTKNAQKRLQKIFKCCSPHFVAPKCSIM